MFTSNFLDVCRTDFVDYVSKFTYVYVLNDDESGTENEAAVKINSVSISGNYIVWSLSPENSVSESHTVTAINLYDSDDTIIGTQSTSVSVNATQAVLIVFKVLYQEVASSNSDEEES